MAIFLQLCQLCLHSFCLQTSSVLLYSEFVAFICHFFSHIAHLAGGLSSPCAANNQPMRQWSQLSETAAAQTSRKNKTCASVLYSKSQASGTHFPHQQRLAHLRRREDGNGERHQATPDHVTSEHPHPHIGRRTYMIQLQADPTTTTTTTSPISPPPLTTLSTPTQPLKTQNHLRRILDPPSVP